MLVKASCLVAVADLDSDMLPVADVLKVLPLLQVTETNMNLILASFYCCDALQTGLNSITP